MTAYKIREREAEAQVLRGNTVWRRFASRAEAEAFVADQQRTAARTAAAEALAGAGEVGRGPMDAAEFRATLEALALTRGRLQRMLGLDKGTPSRWAHGQRPVPMTVALLLRLMAAGLASPEMLETLAGLEEG